MNETNPFPDEADIHAYIDGRLDEADNARMEAWLEHNPARAKEIHGWQQDAQQLRSMLGGLPNSTGQAALDPTMIRARRRQHQRSYAALAAMLVLALGVGAISGWQARRLTLPTAAPMADALQAYRMFALNRHVKLDVTQQHAGELQNWLDQHFRDAATLPNLVDSGFHPVGGRLLATDSGPAAMVLYEDRQGDAISFYMRPPSPHAGTLPRGQRREGQLVASYWSGNGYNYALVSHDDASDMRAIRDASRPSAM